MKYKITTSEVRIPALNLMTLKCSIEGVGEAVLMPGREDNIVRKWVPTFEAPDESPVWNAMWDAVDSYEAASPYNYPFSI